MLLHQECLLLHGTLLSHTVTRMGKLKIDPLARRNVAIAGPVYLDFSHNCEVLGLVREQVNTQLVAGWNRRNARRVAKRLRELADRAAACLDASVSCGEPSTTPHIHISQESY